MKASSSAVQAGYIPEVTWGVTPAAPVKYFRVTSASIKPVKKTVTSDELRADGQVTGMVRVGSSGTASFAFEASAGALDDFLPGALRAAGWTADTGFDGALVGTDLLENGAAGTALKSFTLECFFSDIGQYATLTGARVSQLTLNVKAEDKVTGTIDFMGMVADLGNATLGTGAATAAPATDILSVNDLATFEEGGTSIEFMEFSVTINNNAANQPVASAGATSSLGGIRYGRFEVTGTLKVYLEDRALVGKFLDDTASDFLLGLADAAGNHLNLQLPRIEYTDGGFDAQGNDQDVTVDLPYQAVMDPTTGKTARFERIAV